MITSKLYLPLLLILTFSFSSTAQGDFDGTIEWGEPFNISKRERGPTPIGFAGEYFYATSSVKKNEYLNSFDLNSLSFYKKNKLSFVDGKKKLTKKQNFVFGDDVLFLTSYVDKVEKKEHFLIHKVDNSLILREGTELVALDWEKAPKLAITRRAVDKKLEATNAFAAIPSPDDNYLLVFYAESITAEEKMTILLDKDLNEVARASIKTPFDEFRTISAQFDNNGKYYMLGYEPIEEQTTGLIKRTITQKGQHHVVVYDSKTGKMNDFPVSFDQQIASAAMKHMDDGSLMIYGMYSNENTTGVTGAFFEKYDSEFNLMFSKKTEFEEDFITQHWSEKQKKKAEKKKARRPDKVKEPALYNYIMHNLAVKDNGDVVLIAEQYYMYVTTTTHYGANGSTYTTTTYHYIYNDVVTVNCTKEGEITWKNLIKKRQHSTNDGGYYSSFFTAVDGNDVIFIYNDKEANMDDAEEATTRREKKQAKRNTVAAFITLSEDGEFDRLTLFDFEGDESRTLVPKLCRKMKDKEYLIYTNAPKRGKIFGLAKMN